MPEAQPLVTIRVRHGNQRSTVLFEFASGEQIKLRPRDPGAIRTGQARAGRYLLSFVAKAGMLTPSLTQAHNAFTVLANAGHQLVMGLAGDDATAPRRLQRAFRDARGSSWSSLTDHIPYVQVVGHGALFPFELLPVYDFEPLPEFENVAVMEDAAARFLGFGAVVNRVTHKSHPAGHVLANDPKLPIQLLRHRMTSGAGDRLAKLLGRPPSGSKAEHAYLKELPVEIEGPWPMSLSEAAVARQLLDALYDPSKALDGHPRTASPAQVQHFACHCFTEGDDDEAYRLELSTHGGDPRPLTLAAIRTGYIQRDLEELPHPPTRSVIIMNACGSSKTDPVSAASFPNWFLSNSHPAFVGTETDVPDDVAAEYGVRLYRFLLGGYSLGESVVRARRQLLRDFRSPLGLLYVLYGDSAVRVQKSIPALSRGA